MLEYVRDRLPKARTQLQPIADETGIPAATLEKIARRYTESPRIETLQTLYSYFIRKDDGPGALHDPPAAA